MFTVLSDISWLGFAAAVVATSALGALYFVVLVPQQYVRVLGREGRPAPEQGLVEGLGPVVCNVLTVLTSAILLAALDVTTVGDAVAFGLIVGVGYLTAMTFQIAINPNFPHPIRYGLLNAPYFVVGSLLTSVLLVVV